MGSRLGFYEDKHEMSAATDTGPRDFKTLGDEIRGLEKESIAWGQNLGPREPTERWSGAGFPWRSASKTDLTLVPGGGWQPRCGGGEGVRARTVRPGSVLLSRGFSTPSEPAALPAHLSSCP